MPNEVEQIHEALRSYPESGISEPLGRGFLLYKVGGKMFALMAPEKVPVMLNLKCDPDRAIELRDTYDAIQPGYHMNKKHWNSVYLNGTVPDDMILELIHHSFNLVLSGQSKTFRDRIRNQMP